MSDSHITEFERRCRALATSAAPKWDWDGRFGTAVGVVLKEGFEAAHAHLLESFGTCWSDQELPAAITAITDAMGGMRGGQEVFATDVAGGPVLFCAWWPWGGNSKVSLRIGVWSDELGAHADLLKEWFGIAG